MVLERKNLWAPWRMKYIRGLKEKHACFICHDLENPNEDEKNYVLWRGEHCLVMFNKFPYNNGHLLVAPNRHIAGLNEASDAEMAEMMAFIRECQKALDSAISPEGFNVGMNFGRCAGAGLPEHMHIHIVPRWNGDTNYMHVCSDTDVISQSMDELYGLLKKVSIEKGLPNLQGGSDE